MKLDIKNWKKFKIGDLFVKQNIKKFSSIIEEEGKFRFISSSSENQGVVKNVNINNSSILIYNCLTISTNGKCFDVFYHDYEIIISSDVEILKNIYLNKYNAFFISTLLKKEQKNDHMEENQKVMRFEKLL